MTQEAVPRPVSTEVALRTANLLPLFEIAGLGKGVAADACEMLRTLVSERDALAVRVRELEAAIWVAHEALSKSPCDAKFVQQCSVCSALDYTRAALTTPESKL